ncbi:MAG TPA: hypothetical protein VE826_15075 [Dongiaceae bacterium]|nr:hypothetical protein [Dongiaceae bacterium]
MTYTVGKYESVSPESVTDEIILEGFRSLKETMEYGFGSVNGRIDALRTEMNQRFADVDHRMMRRFDERDARIDDHERRISKLEPRR